MKFVLSLVLLFSSAVAFAHSREFTAGEHTAIKAVLDRAQAETGGNCDHEDINSNGNEFNVQVYCESMQEFIWYYVYIKPCLDYQNQWYLWASAPLRLPDYKY